MPTAISKIIESFPELIDHIQGPKETEVSMISPTESPAPDSLIFLHNKQWLDSALASPARAVVVAAPLLDLARDMEWGDKTLLASKNIQLAMAQTMKSFFPVSKNKTPFDGEKIHPSAVISKSAQIGENVLIGPMAVVGPGAIIGAGSIIGGSSYIEADVEMGENCHVHPQVFIGHSSKIGNNCEIHPQTSIGTEGYGYAHDQEGNHHRITHYGRVVLEDNVHIGANFSIDRGTFGDTVIGEGTKIDNHGHIAHNVKIGRRCLITAGFIVAGSTEIGNFNVFGGRSSVGGHIKLTDHVQVAGMSGVESNIEKPGNYGGFPVLPHSKALKAYATLAHLPQMRKNLARLMKKLGMTAD